MTNDADPARSQDGPEPDPLAIKVGVHINESRPGWVHEGRWIPATPELAHGLAMRSSQGMIDAEIELLETRARLREENPDRWPPDDRAECLGRVAREIADAAASFADHARRYGHPDVAAAYEDVATHFLMEYGSPARP